MENQIVNQQASAITSEQIEILQNWSSDHDDISCLHASELLFLFTGHYPDFVCTESEISGKRRNKEGSKIQERGIRIYPNPATQYCNLDLESLSGEICQVRVSDITGRTMMNLSSKQDQYNLIIPTTNWPSGVYTVTIICETLGFTETNKLIIE